MSENNYVEVLSKIKAAEENASRALAEKKSELERELEALRVESRSAVEKAHREASLIIESAVQRAREDAEKEADEIISGAQKEAAEKTEKTVDKRILRRFIEEILFSELRK